MKRVLVTGSKGQLRKYKLTEKMPMDMKNLISEKSNTVS